MISSAANTTSLSNDVLSLLPMIYVGWSDSVLSPTEMKIIENKISQLSHLSDSDKKYLLQWVNPLNPPSENEFKFWGSQIKAAAQGMDVETKKSLVTLGAEIAAKGDKRGPEKITHAKETKAALQDLKQSLGLNSESDALLIQKLFPNENIIEEQAFVPSFDPNELKKVLDGEHGVTRDRVKTILSDPMFSLTEDRDKEVFRKKTLERLIELCKQGLSAYAFPKEYGGLEKNGEHIAAFETLGYGDMSLAIKFGVQIGLFGGAVLQLGTAKHHELYIEKLLKGELLGCFAMTETGHGSNVKDLETTATYDHSTGEIIVHSPSFSAGKEYIGNAMDSTMAAVFAQLIVDGESHGVHTVLVPLRDADHNTLPGVTVKDCGYKMGLNGVDNGRIWFDQVSVPKDNLLNKFGGIDETGAYTSPINNPSKRFFSTLGALVAGRICVGMLGLNASKVALTIATKYAYKRRQFGHKGSPQETLIIDYPTHQSRLFPLIAKTYAYYLCSLDLANKYSHASEEEIREVETLAAGLKAKSTWLATQTIQTCREACGGKGYLYENRFAGLKADTDIFTTFEGDNTVLMQLVAKGALTEFKQSFHDDGYRAVMRFILTKAKHEAYEFNPLFTRNTDTEHLLDSKFHFHAFNYRKKKVLMSLSERMQKYIKRGIDPQQVFLRVQPHMMHLADAFIDQVVLTSFYSHIDKCDNPDAKKALTTLAQLYALDNIHGDRGWFLESEYMDGSKTKAIRRLTNKLYQDIKPNALGYIDAFSIPNELIDAPIAMAEWS